MKKLVRLFALCSLVALVGCNSTDVDVNVGGGSPTGPSLNTAVVTHVTVSTPNERITLNRCEALIEFSATVYGNAFVTQTVNWARVGEGNFLPNGIKAFLGITKNGRYIVTATSTQDPSKSASVTVDVFGDCGGTNPVPAPPTTCDIKATPNSFPAGGGTTKIEWSSNGSVTSNWDGPKPSSGSELVPVSSSRTFRIDCSGPGGLENEEVIVTVGTPVPPVPPVTPQCVVATHGHLSPSSGSGTPGQTTTVTASFTSQGGAVCGPPYYFSSSPGNVSVNSSTGLITFVSPGSATICAQPQQNVTQPQTCGTFTTTSAPTTPPPTTPSVVSISVQPKTFSCTVGGQATVGANVTVTGNASTAVMWSLSNSSVASIKMTSQNSVVISCLATGTVRVTATAVADPSKSDYADGTVTNGVINCTWTTTTGLQSDGSVIIDPSQNITGTASCTNSTGASFLPAWFSSDPSRVGVRGDSQTTVDGRVFQTGNTATISGVFRGQALISVQAAIDQTSPSFSRLVVVR